MVFPCSGRAPNYDNAFFAFGNSHFGITAGPVMGKHLAEIVAGRKPGIDLAPFSSDAVRAMNGVCGDSPALPRSGYRASSQ